jgi:hypothetical protein
LDPQGWLKRVWQTRLAFSANDLNEKEGKSKKEKKERKKISLEVALLQVIQ